MKGLPPVWLTPWPTEGSWNDVEPAAFESNAVLLRQYFRKGTDLSAVEQAEVRFAADEINGRPRAFLVWDSATARFAALEAVAAL